MPHRFSWVIGDKIAGMERPGLFEDLETDLSFLKKEGIDTIVNLEEKKRQYTGFETFHLPIPDFSPPSHEDFESFVKFLKAKVEEGNRSVVVHCYAGMGRTNLMIASYLVATRSMRPDHALEFVKERRPVFMVTEKQEEALWEFYYTIVY